MNERRPHFGLWAPYRGQWVFDPAREENPVSFALSNEVILNAERAGFDTVWFAQHTIYPRDQDDEILEAWTACVAARPTDAQAQEFLADLSGRRGDLRMRTTEREAKIDPKAQTIHFSRKCADVEPIGANGGILPGFVGGYDRVARRFADFCEAGVTTFLLSLFPLLEERERFAAEIIPRVRALTRTRRAA